MPHLVVSISGHGFGHVAMTAPILNLLHERMPQLRLTVRSTVPIAHLRARIKAPFTHLSSEGDIGMVMSSALDVNVEESRAAYRAFHADWDARVIDEARLLRELGADFVLSNVGYLPLAGAQRAEIPNIALCSINWADIYRHYCGAPFDTSRSARHSGRTGSVSGETEDVLSDAAITAQIQDCYANADAFLRAVPGMAMETLPNTIPVAPISAVGANRRDELDRHLKLASGEKLVLVSLGGITSRVPIEHWPRIAGVRWLIPNSWQVQHPDAIALESLHMDFLDLLASCDLHITKPGYGSFVEASCCGVPVLFVDRPDWPESRDLISWLQQHNVCREVSRPVLEQGDIAAALDEIWHTPRVELVVPQGAEQVAAWLMQKLG